MADSGTSRTLDASDGASTGASRDDQRHDDGAEAPEDGARLRVPPALNLGCGTDYRDGWHNVDVLEATDPDEVVDLDDHPWPWPDDAFHVVAMNNVIEHLDDQLGALQELHRIVEPGGCISLAFPHPNSRGQWIDPTHAHTVHPKTFEHEVAPDFDVLEVDCSRVRFGRLLPADWALWWADHLGYIVDEVQVELSPQK